MNREALRLYLVTNRYQDSVESFLEKVEKACRSGVTIVQLREKNLTTNQYYQTRHSIPAIAHIRPDRFDRWNNGWTTYAT